MWEGRREDSLPAVRKVRRQDARRRSLLYYFIEKKKKERGEKEQR